MRYTSHATRAFVAVATALIIACASSCHTGSKRDDTSAAEPSVDTIPTMVMQIQKCSRLYTTEYQIHKVVTHDDHLAMQGKLAGHDYNISLPLGKRKVAIPIDATVKAYVDFSSFSERNVRRNGKRIEIVLPDPRIVLTSSRIDHGGIREYVALTRRNFSDEELASYERQGRDAIIADIAQTDIIERARVSAAHTLVPMLQQMGFSDSDITVTFRRDFTPQDIKHIIDKSTVEHAKQK